MPAVEIEELTVRHGELTAVDRVSLAVQPGEVVVLLGANGAGKTSLVEAAEGFVTPAGGRVSVLGCDPVAQRHQVTSRWGVMLQEGGLPLGGRPAELMALEIALKGAKDGHELLERLGLDERRQVGVRRLSGGERQRLALALALVGRPEVLFLDEPTAGVDVAGRQVIRALIAERSQQGAAVLVTTHELDEARRMADRVAVLDRGRLVANGTLDELRARADRAELRFAAARGLDVVALSDHLGVHVAELAAGEYAAALAPTPEAVARLTAWLAERGIALDELRANRPSLEDLFLELTGDEEA